MGSGASIWEKRGWGGWRGWRGCMGDCRPDLENKNADNNSLDFRARKLSPKFSCIKFSGMPSGHGRLRLWVKEVLATKKLCFRTLREMGKQFFGPVFRRTSAGYPTQKLSLWTAFQFLRSRVQKRNTRRNHINFLKSTGRPGAP